MIACGDGENAPREVIRVGVTEFTDQQYPDNPDIGFRATDYQFDLFQHAEILAYDLSNYSLNFYLNPMDTIQIGPLDLSEWFPQVPSHLKSDPYLSELSLINQEWNRNQVALRSSEFTSSNEEIVRVDLARNCLNAYLWELIVYVEEGGNELPYAHAWFDFPHAEYEQTFSQLNATSFDSLRSCLVDWKDPESKLVDTSVLREVLSSEKIMVRDLSDFMYPVDGARKKKRKEVIYPTSYSSMRELQTDSALFATFSKPGFYNKQDPRTTELGRFSKVEEAFFRSTESVDQSDLIEIELSFFHTEDSIRTKFIMGGIPLTTFPKLSPDDANSGWKSSMGFGNHTFYESLNLHQSSASKNNTYYAYLTDEEGKWLDSHKIGIDGPIVHFDIDFPHVLHIWFLSFERHALVGHYALRLPVEKAASI